MREVNAIFITLVLALFVHVIKTFVYWVLDLFLFYTYKLFQLGQSCLAASMIRGYSRVQHSTIFSVVLVIKSGPHVNKARTLPNECCPQGFPHSCVF